MDVGRITAKLDAVFDDTAFHKFDRSVKSARNEAHRGVNAHLDAKADTSGFNKFDREIKQARGEARKGTTAHLDAKADTRGFDKYNRAVRDTNAKHEDLIRGSGRLRGAFGSLFFGGAGVAAGATAFYGLARGGKAVIDAFSETAKVGAQTDAVLKSTKGAAGMTSKSIGDLATSISKKSGMDDEAVQSGENLLLTFTQIRNETGKGNDIFTQSTGIMADMSQALGQDMKSSAIQLGKALNDPIKGVTALQRVGVSFTQSQKDQIKHLVDTGQKLKAQKLILGELRKEFGGSAAAYGKTMPGALDKMKVALGNVAEAIGKKLAPWVTKAANFITGFANKFLGGGKAADNLKNKILGVVRPIVNFVGALVRAVAGGGRFERIMRNIGTAIADTARFFAPLIRRIADVVIKIAGFTSKLLGSKVALIAIRTIIGAMVGRLAAMAAAFAVGKIVAFARGLYAVFTALKSVRTGIALVNTIAKGSPLMLMATVIGAIAGALGLFSSGNKRAATSARDLTDAINAQHDALRELRDMDIDAAQRKIELKQANLSLKQAEGAVNDLRKRGKTNTDQYKQAEITLQQARLDQKRAARAVGDTEADVTRKRQDATNATSDAISKSRGRIKTLKDEITGVKALTDKTSWMYVGDKKAAQLKAVLRGKQAELNKEMNRLPHLEGRLNALRRGEDAARASAGAARSVLSGMRGTMSGVSTALGRLTGHSWRVKVSLDSTINAAINTVNQLANQLARLPHRAKGGPVGPNFGGAKLFIAGEGGKDEWVISQEGNRNANIGWAKEALEKLTGRKVELHAGGRGLAAGTVMHNDRKFAARVNSDEAVLKPFSNNLSRKQHEYTALDRKLNETEEKTLIEHDDGSITIDTDAVNRRSTEIDQLEAKKNEIRALLVAYQSAKADAIPAYQRLIKDLDKNRALQVAWYSKKPKKVRDRYVNSVKSQFDAYLTPFKSRLSELQGENLEIDLDIGDIDLDVADLEIERGGLTQGARGADTPTGGGDTGGTDPGPTPEEIAAQVRTQVESFAQTRQDLLSSFGSNFVRAGANGFADPLAAAGGPSQYGALGAVQGAIPVAGTDPTLTSGGGGVMLVNNFKTQPPDPLPYSKSVQAELSALG